MVIRFLGFLYFWLVRFRYSHLYRLNEGSSARFAVFNRERFRSEIESFSNSRYFFMAFSHDFLSSIFSLFFEPGKKIKLVDKPEYAWGFREKTYFSILVNLIRWLEKEKCVAVLVPGYQYGIESDLAFVAKKNGTTLKFVVFMREGFYASSCMGDYKCRYESLTCALFDKVFVQHCFLYRALRDVGLDNVELYCPRRFRVLPLESHKPKTVLLVSFLPDIYRYLAPIRSLTYLRDSFSSHQALELTEFCADVHRQFVAVSRLFPDVQFVIKAKWGGSWQGLIEGYASEAGPPPENLHLVCDGNAEQFVSSADLAIVFSSSVALECSARNVPVITPMYFEALRPAIQMCHPLFIEFNNLSLATNRDDLFNNMCSFCLGDYVGEVPKFQLEYFDFEAPDERNVIDGIVA